MFSHTAQYALRAMAWLAQQVPNAQTTQQIADGTNLRPGYLSKVLQMLGRAGFVHSQRGPHGGFTLNRAPEEVTLLEIVNVIEPVKRFRACPFDVKEHGSALCPLHRRLDGAMEMIENVLAQTSVADLVSEMEASREVTVSALKGGNGKADDGREQE